MKASREGTMVGEFEVNQEDDDTDEVDGFDDFMKRCTMTVLDVKLTKECRKGRNCIRGEVGSRNCVERRVLGKDWRSTFLHQMGSREQGHIIQAHREGQVGREEF